MADLPRTLFLSSGDAIILGPGVYHWDLAEPVAHTDDMQGGNGPPLYMALTGFEIRGWVGTSNNPANYNPELVRIICEEIRGADMENGTANNGLLVMEPMDYDTDRKTSHGPDPVHSNLNYNPVTVSHINHITLRVERSPWGVTPNDWQPVAVDAAGPTYAFWISLRFVS